MLEVEGLSAWYGASHALRSVGFSVAEGEILCLLGRNGAGKTTALKAIMGLLPRRAGSVRFRGEEVLRRPAEARFHLGLAYVPKERRIVPGLTVRENLRLGLIAARARRDEARALDRVAETFPRLGERLDQQATTMSGGEQQMLASARAGGRAPRCCWWSRTWNWRSASPTARSCSTKARWSTARPRPNCWPTPRCKPATARCEPRGSASGRPAAFVPIRRSRPRCWRGGRRRPMPPSTRWCCGSASAARSSGASATASMLATDTSKS